MDNCKEKIDWSWTLLVLRGLSLRSRPHVYRYFWIRNFFFPDSAPSTYPAYESETFCISSPEWEFVAALYTNMRILKFKSQLTIAFFVNGPLLKETKLYFNGFKRSWFVICDWWISIRFVCFCVSRLLAWDRSYDWRQRKTQSWRRLLNFSVRMFVKSAVIHYESLFPSQPFCLVTQRSSPINGCSHSNHIPFSIWANHSYGSFRAK